LQRSVGFVLQRSVGFVLQRSVGFVLQRSVGFFLQRSVGFFWQRSVGFVLQRSVGFALPWSDGFSQREVTKMISHPSLTCQTNPSLKCRTNPSITNGVVKLMSQAICQSVSEIIIKELSFSSVQLSSTLQPILWDLKTFRDQRSCLLPSGVQVEVVTRRPKSRIQRLQVPSKSRLRNIHISRKWRHGGLDLMADFGIVVINIWGWFAIHVLLMRCILIVSTHFRIGVSIAQAARESPGAWDLGWLPRKSLWHKGPTSFLFLFGLCLLPRQSYTYRSLGHDIIGEVARLCQVHWRPLSLQPTAKASANFLFIDCKCNARWNSAWLIQ